MGRCVGGVGVDGSAKVVGCAHAMVAFETAHVMESAHAMG